MNKIKFLICSIAVVLISCKSNETADSDKVVQTEIYQSYSVSYDAASKKQELGASFRFGGSNGTTLRLVKESNVTWNGQLMQEDNSIFSGTYYQYQKVGELIAENTFVYTDNDGKSYKNVIPLLKAEPIVEGNVISKQTNNVISWSGLPSSAVDEVKIILKDSVKEFYFYPRIVGSNNITISSNDLKDVKEGNANIYIQRTVTSALQNGNPIGGELYSEYLSNTIIVKIVK